MVDDLKLTWLCPSTLHRERLMDMEQRMAGPRKAMYGAAALLFVLGGPWLGPACLVPLLGGLVGLVVLKPRIATAERPEYVIAGTAINAQIMIAIGIALSGGPQSPAIPILLLPLVTLCARFSLRGVLAGVALTLVLLLAGTVGVDPRGFLDDPTFVLAGVCATVGVLGFCNALVGSDIDQRAAAIVDPLTGLLNRKALMSRFAELAHQARLTGGPVAMIICDLDDFKLINDEHGHGCGDAVLKEIADAMRRSLRFFDLIYRLGGEEFIVVLPGIAAGEAAGLAERLRVSVESARPVGLYVTASLGVATADGDALQFETLFRAADEALYRAKGAGRNRVVVATQVHGGKSAESAATMAMR